MDKRFVIFLVVAFSVLTLNAYVVHLMRGPEPVAVDPDAEQPAAPAEIDQADGDQPKNPDADPVEKPEVVEEPEQPPEGPPPVAGETHPQWLALGSAAADSPYRMLVILASSGAAVEQVELNDGTHDLTEGDHSGYFGPLAETDAPQGAGAVVNVVGPGTPAAAAGLKAGDVITSFNDRTIRSVSEYREALKATKVGQSVALQFTRDGQPQPAGPVVLAARPLKVLSREQHGEDLFDPPSFLTTLARLDDQKLPLDKDELPGLSLRQEPWEVRRATPSEVEFVRALPERGVEIVKRYRLAEQGNPADDGTPRYHLDLTVELRNTRGKPVEVAYQLDGPTGLPTEGWWYANKQSIGWSGVGVRDVAMRVQGGDAELLGCVSIVDGEVGKEAGKKNVNAGLRYIGVDAQYFSAILLPLEEPARPEALDSARVLTVGPIPADKALKKLTNVSCRLTSKPVTLQKKGDSLSHTYRVFIGPKKQDMLAEYGLQPLVYFGWFSPVSEVLLGILHFFFSVVKNYGLSIIMLTVLVRGAMFPLSRKQALSAQKMQEIQPELKKLNEKFKSQPEQRNKATMELFRKHNYNPYGGCLIMFIQLPIFIGLYRALMIDVELRGASLIPGLDWCSNLAAPDMLHRWDTWQPFLTGYTSMLGPYFNLLPLFTVGLFLWQQKQFMPPPADEQAAMQQKIMKYMMIFMSFMFFKVPSGLCIYFIASSLWGIAERKLLPKSSKPGESPVHGGRPAPRDTNGASDNGAASKRKKQRGK